MQEHCGNFFGEVFTELQERDGEIEEVDVCNNLGDHLMGNAHVKLRHEEGAEQGVMSQ